MAKPYFISKWTTSFYYINYIPDKADVSSIVEIHCNLKMNLPLTMSTTTSAVWNMTTMKMEENGPSNGLSTTTSDVWNMTTMTMEENGPSNEGIDTGNWLL